MKNKILSYKNRLLKEFKNLNTFLDFGCGPGDFIELVLTKNARKILAVDSIEKMVSLVNR